MLGNLSLGPWVGSMYYWFHQLVKPTKFKRFLFFLFFDIIFFFLSFLISVNLVFNLSFVQIFNSSKYLFLFPFFVILKLSFLYFFRLYQINWRFVGIKDLLNLILGLFCVNFLAFCVLFLAGSSLYSFFFVDYIISVCFVSFLRISKRIYLEFFENQSFYKSKKVDKILIIGAGVTGESIVRSILRSKDCCQVVGFLDDDVNKQNTYIHGFPVLGPIDSLPYFAKKFGVDAIIIAITTLHHKKIQYIYDLAQNIGIKKIKIAPSISQLPSKLITVRDLRDINIEDLLARKPVQVQTDRIKKFLMNKVVLVTGAGGSIGSETVRQLLRFSPKTIIAYEIDETELHSLSLEVMHLLEKFNVTTKFVPIVGNIRDKNKVKSILEKYQVDIIFHAAAYKHVPLMEYFPEEAILTNVFGTYLLADLAANQGVKKFINISTDKAVNPTSIMGASKRLAEIICTAFDAISDTKFVSVRFGNVLGSRGSVIPIFLDQIKKGGPVTVTHPEMRRYFMTIPEAVLLIFQAALLGKGGEVFVLDMGEPVKIVDLAKRLIRMHGLEPGQDIEIIYTGLRPGEKLFEELLTAEEGTQATSHDKIFIARISTHYPLGEIRKILTKLELAIRAQDDQRIRKVLKEYIPFYNESSANSTLNQEREAA